ncbi:ATP-binding cassette domain-containing protein [Actinomadura opuntiae]|uniref:ATP-binding cassette domain-containing protein n=1 Tax=Actinomadura sp. OS1-43 TaxID=604315 RepID=UPI00255ABC2A|nr:ATP-binding cassette domain-containing protein [Actinomadura sp. OS1-43]MDL4818694.1 ATP-binding cassette domain-containing protein [Actinomadura sp. OS1-43]
MTSAPSKAIEVVGLRKSFGKQTVLDGIDFEVPAGTVFSLLGPNGAGKTTTVQILTTLIGPDAGRAVIAGHDLAKQPRAVRAAIGVTGQFSAVDKLLTGEENLLLMARLAHLGKQEGRARTAELLERFDLADAAGKIASAYSGGMRRRLDLAMSLMGRPQIIFLDEPTTGLDPRSRRTMWQIVQELVGEGTTVFLTTQVLEEADRLADRIAMLDGGKLVAQGTPQELKKQVPGGHVTLTFADAESLEAALRILGGPPCDREMLSVDVPSDGSVASLKSLLAKFDDDSVEVANLSIHSPDLDDVFFALTDHGAAEPADEAGDGAPDEPADETDAQKATK